MEHWRSYLVGRLLELFGRRESALVAYKATLRSKPDFHSCANRLAYVLGSLERYAQAEPYFVAVLRADPGNAAAWGQLGDAHAVLGVILENDGRPTEAIEEYRASLAMEPKSPSLSSFFLWSAGHIAMLEAEMGRGSQATVALAKHPVKAA